MRKHRQESQSVYSMKRNVLSVVNERLIEVSFPIVLRGTGTTYPAGQTTYAAGYSFVIDNGNLNYNTIVDITPNLMDQVVPYTIGRSQEFFTLSKAFSHFRLKNIQYSFVRTYVTTSSISNLSPISLGVIASRPEAVNAGTITQANLNYYLDGATYYQPVNDIKDVEWTVKNMPDTLLKAGVDGTFNANAWAPFTEFTTLGIYLTLGQSLYCITTSNVNGFLREIGHAVIRLRIEMGIPQTT